MEPILVVMAAGMGSRYGGNKQLDPITAEGDIIMDFSLYDAYAAGFRRVAFVVKREFCDTLKSHIDKGVGKSLETHYVFQDIDNIPEGYAVPEGRTKPWGTGHAVLSAKHVIDAPFAVINADDYYGRSAFAKMYDFLKNAATAEHQCMVGFRIENTLSENGKVSRGCCVAKDGKLVGIEEHLEVGRDETGNITGIDTSGIKREISEGSPVSMNLWGFDRSFIDVLERDFGIEIERIIRDNPLKGEFYLPSAIAGQLRSGESDYEVLTSDDKWFGVTYREDKPGVVAKFKEMKESGYYPRELRK